VCLNKYNALQIFDLQRIMNTKAERQAHLTSLCIPYQYYIIEQLPHPSNDLPTQDFPSAFCFGGIVTYNKYSEKL
jgi:hypothetical protein